MSLKKRIVRGGLALFLLAGGLSAIVYGLPAARSDAASLGARWEVTQWREGRVKMPGAAAWGRVRRQLLEARDMTPDNAQIYDDLGFIHAYRAQGVAGVPELDDLKQALLSQAEAYYRTAVTLRPMFPYSWAHLALTQHYLGQHGPDFWKNYDAAFAYGKNESGIQRILGEIAFANWSSLGPERERAMRHLVTHGAPHVKKELIALAAAQGIVFETSNASTPSSTTSPNEPRRN